MIINIVHISLGFDALEPIDLHFLRVFSTLGSLDAT